MVEPNRVLLAPRTARVPAHYVANFARQLAVLLASGVPLLLCLEALSFQPEYPHFGIIVECVAQDVSDGQKFSRSLGYHPGIFNDSFVAMTSVGEETGGLDRSLDLLADWIEREDRVARRMKMAMVYPLSVLAVATVLTALLFTLILPTFAQILKEMQVPLPLITRFTLGLTALAGSPYFWLAVVLLIGLAVRAWKLLWRSPRQARVLYSIIQPLPALGSMLRHGSLTRYCACSHALLTSGLTLTKALRMAGRASANPIFDQDSRRLAKCVEAGEGLSQSMADVPSLYSTTLVQMVQAGEESSQLGEMYLRVGRYHELELESSIEILSATLEPLLLVGVASTVGVIVLSVYMPMHSALQNLAL